ncbi:thiol-disulfide oxidoreductase DCC family protein [Thalassobacillus sp. CUG 92003]|uniref:thiol-disulfide oxidoreductase DCC family protein n=1 Tax=Thalassobacillus sp. CUG 92003 TaxID=2736641 RepID=UPI0015E73722|nr:DUF393 domain-containing protein [Thalassobacillus sp. CUG 92003]
MKHVVFYDAKCPLCMNTKRVLKPLDWKSRIEWVPVQEADVEDYPFLKGRNVYDEIYMQASSGVVYVGFYTIRRLLSALPVTRPVSLLLHLPGAALLGSPLYKWVSRHRYEWFGRYD